MKAVFLDRDGVINDLIYYKEVGIINSPFTVGLFRLKARVGEAIRLLNRIGLKVIVTSNQPGVAKNHFTVDVLHQMDDKMTRELEAQGAHLDAIYYCLHHPDGENSEYRVSCLCRKPLPGLLLQAADNFDLDLWHCYMVGDNLSDIKAGRSAGCRTLLIGRMKCDLCRLMDEEGARPDAIVADLLEAAKTISEWQNSVNP